MTTKVSNPIDEFILGKVLPHPLRKQGKEHLTLCPFHKDHNPSLSINIPKQLYHCWGCGKSGTLRSLLQEMSSKAGVEVPYSSSPDSYKELRSTVDDHTEAILKLLEKTDPQRAENIRLCGTEWYGAQCGDCSTIGAYKRRCHDRLCPSCRAASLARWWAEHDVSSALENPALICLNTEPTAFTSSKDIRTYRKQTLNMLHSIQKRCKINKGLYSLTAEIFRGQIQIRLWLVTEASLQDVLDILIVWGELGGKCQLKDCVIDQGLHAVVDRFDWAIRHEIIATNHSDLQDWLVAAKGTKLIQGFGDLYAVTKPRHGKGFMARKIECPHCKGTNMNYLGKLYNPTIHKHGKGYVVYYHHLAKPRN